MILEVGPCVLLGEIGTGGDGRPLDGGESRDGLMARTTRFRLALRFLQSASRCGPAAVRARPGEPS